MSGFGGGETAFEVREREFESDLEGAPVLSEPFSWDFRRHSIFASGRVRRPIHPYLSPRRDHASFRTPNANGTRLIALDGLLRLPTSDRELGVHEPYGRLKG